METGICISIKINCAELNWAVPMLDHLQSGVKAFY